MTATPRNNPAQPQTPSDQAFWHRLHTAACTTHISNAIRHLYEQLDAQIHQRGPVCWSSGKCCNFEQYGHRLYVTALEIAWVLAQTKTPAASYVPTNTTAETRVRLPQIAPQKSCPFQIDRRCSVHTIRPMGCRIFFCQQSTQQWQNDLYETFLKKLHHLHDNFDLPYRYIEWRAGLGDAIHHRDTPPMNR